MAKARSTSYDAVHTLGETAAWLDTQPSDGRAVVVTWTPGRGIRAATPDGFDVDTNIHAYGGGAYAFLPDSRIVCRYRRHGLDHLGICDPAHDHLEPRPLPFTSIKPYLRCTADRLAFIGIVHAVYYPPTNHAVIGPPGQRPPLIVEPHPGPTSHAPARLELRTQFFTSPGFAVVVDHRGSTGYGRAYRTGSTATGASWTCRTASMSRRSSPSAVTSTRPAPSSAAPARACSLRVGG